MIDLKADKHSARTRLCCLRTVDELMDHLRTIPKEVLDKKLEAVVAEREKFSFQPYITAPPSAVNIILSKMCTMGLHLAGPDQTA